VLIQTRCPKCPLPKVPKINGVLCSAIGVTSATLIETSAEQDRTEDQSSDAHRDWYDVLLFFGGLDFHVAHLHDIFRLRSREDRRCESQHTKQRLAPNRTREATISCDVITPLRPQVSSFRGVLLIHSGGGDLVLSVSVFACLCFNLRLLMQYPQS